MIRRRLDARLGLIRRLCVIAVALRVCVGGAALAGEPRIVIDDPTHDFSTVDEGTLVYNTFSIHNGGDAELRIDRVDTPCGCTVATASGSKIGPGESGTVSTYFDTSGFAGPKTKRVVLITNDPNGPVRELVLTGEVTPKLVANPPKLYLGTISPDSVTTREIEITRPAARPPRIASATADDAAIQATIRQGVDDESVRRVEVRIAPEAVRGEFNSVLRIATDEPVGEIEVPVFGTVEGDLVVDPAHIALRSVGRAGTRRLRLRNRGHDPVAVEDVRLSNMPLDYSIRTLRTGYDYRITLRFGRNAASGGRGNLHIYTTHPREPDLVVPYAMVPPAVRRSRSLE